MPLLADANADDSDPTRRSDHPLGDGGRTTTATPTAASISAGTTVVTYLEFYSGIGGWSYALEEAFRRLSAVDGGGGSGDGAGAEGGTTIPTPETTTTPTDFVPRRLAAFDHSELCNSVLRHNFPEYCGAPGSGVDGGPGGGGDDDDDEGAESVETPSSSLSPSKKKKKKRKRPGGRGGGNDDERPVSIESLTPRRLRRYGRAEIWAMSPPCQPYTRQHGNRAEKELSDPRNKSFLHLVELVRKMEGRDLPGVILMENVVGFEESESCQRWISALRSRGYYIAHFHITPTQVGLPNDRPRYYCVAVRETEFCDGDGDSSSTSSGNRGSSEARGSIDSEIAMLFREGMRDGYGRDGAANGSNAPRIITSVPAMGIVEDSLHGDTTRGVFDEKKNVPLHPPIISEFLDASLCDNQGNPFPCPDPSILDPDKNNGKHVEMNGVDSKVSFTREAPSTKEATDELLDALRVPSTVLQSDASWCFDIVTPHDWRSSCFTRSYGSYVKGTGSVLFLGGKKGEAERGHACEDRSDEDGSVPTERFKLVPPEQRKFDRGWSDGLNLEKNLRYFSGTEIARLMGFPVSAPASISGSGGSSDLGVNDGDNSGAGTERSRAFSFPPSCTNKQQWRLLGNSLNVRVAALVAEIGFRGRGLVVGGMYGKRPTAGR